MDTSTTAVMSETQVDIVSLEDLTPEHWLRWTEFRRGNSALYSPYFHPDYSKTVEQLHNNCYVAIIKDSDGVIGFLPYQQKTRGGSATALGAPMTDYHGVISTQPLELDMKVILSSAKINTLNMPRLPKTVSTACAVMCLEKFETADAWRDNNSASYKRFYKTLKRKARKTDRDLGQREFVWQSQDPEYLPLLLNWKSAQLIQSNHYDVFGVQWTRQLLSDFLANGPSSDLRADMHIMRIGGKPAAIDLGLTDGKTYHSWILSYAPEFSKVSPGAQLKEAMIDQSAELGYKRFDIGTGIDRHKAYYTTEDIESSNTLWLGSGLQSSIAKAYAGFEQFGSSYMKDIPGKFRRRYNQVSACDPQRSGQIKSMLTAIKTGGSRG